MLAITRPERHRVLRGPWLALFLLVASTVYFCPLVRPFPLLDPDEGLHAAIAQEMVESGDWVSPRFCGEPFYDKPILFFWAQIASLKLFGMNEVAVRLPGLCCAFLGAVTTMMLARQLVGPTAGWISGVFYATLGLPAALAQAPVHDVALVPWSNLALLALWRMSQAASPRAQVAWSVPAGAAMGLAMLTKGLLGVAIIGLTFVTFLLAARRLSLTIVAATSIAGLVGLLVASPWFAVMEWRHPGYLSYYFIERHLLGYVTSSQHHGSEPWWYYVPILFGGALPWLVFLPTTAVSDRPYRDWNRGTLFCWIWLVSGFLFLSVANSKLLTYMSPVFPAVAILAATAWARCIHGQLDSVARRLFHATAWAACLSGAVAALITLLIAQELLAERWPIALWLTAALAGTPSLISLWLFVSRPRRIFASLSFGVATVAIGALLMITQVVPRVATGYTAKRLAEHVNSVPILPESLIVVEERIGSLVFYLDPAVRRELRQRQFQSVAMSSVRDWPTWPQNTAVVVPAVSADKAPTEWRLDRWQSVDRYRLWWPHQVTASPPINKTPTAKR